ncbi:Asp23/Gls24 family envelope stress response protein [Facklamia hominis]|uniref:Asp23/Gls24 family envelope stress response protein n=1 Tax=Facklamia hominis CCUG 36813 TaxID=883111 RepID=K1MBM1_9LACT|nr:Asp23/Gls24 family envelope stress response protein [Facklamia hominis]EKB53419.1 hypothetical protein HMPREF9706_01677 [Facklamia hominis CCUG 36813]EPH11614.1 hypothetical protein HMPREF9260_00936 [Facklamia hominis ACS-120-V-Sch10]PKY93229.1 Asp23/Gls24 family envelope stress response protein [Facklamia hominis]RYC97921.1 Asp23/Gls24 family envelope stress response protein [Facklamia hominis]WPJ90193.1 Asp23/Gls24 family envelope stress response protein [Facklamia hominis]
MPKKSKNQAVAFERQEGFDLGEINITTGVLEDIAAKAASEVEGVIRPTAKGEGNNFFRFETSSLNAKLKQEADKMRIDVYIKLHYGYSVPRVAMQVQDRIKEQILFMTDLVIDQVNVHVTAIETDSSSEASFFQLDDEMIEEVEG